MFGRSMLVQLSVKGYQLVGGTENISGRVLGTKEPRVRVAHAFGCWRAGVAGVAVAVDNRRSHKVELEVARGGLNVQRQNCYNNVERLVKHWVNRERINE